MEKSNEVISFALFLVECHRERGGRGCSRDVICFKNASGCRSGRGEHRGAATEPRTETKWRRTARGRDSDVLSATNVQNITRCSRMQCQECGFSFRILQSAVRVVKNLSPYNKYPSVRLLCYLEREVLISATCEVSCVIEQTTLA